ncbi:putative repeat protein (TIGR02543 family) [Ereboglobus sp. PH5-5]|uniref:InlB B-repeat-containing protein n=1 Tax=Ereboglobus sp. PH5-5 TaxID=2940529 RepID=UPI0024074C26|nr:InlB B-repeat-containing protein [Ereboglobus sp. PH5-5]MDF9832343.1 putative repeat protein (TIGR02543 family) [Ereboglobus sp. PH5-5]
MIKGTSPINCLKRLAALVVTAGAFLLLAATASAASVSSITRYSPATETTTSAAVVFKVTFSEAFAGADAADFEAIVDAGVTGAAVTGVRTDTDDPTLLYVTISGLSLESAGAVGLKVSDAATISDSGGNPIPGGYDSGETYTRAAATAPAFESGTRNTTATWLGTVSNDYNLPANWADGIVPGSGHRVRIDPSLPATPAVNIDLTNSGDDTVSHKIGGFAATTTTGSTTLTLSSTGSGLLQLELDAGAFFSLNGNNNDKQWTLILNRNTFVNATGSYGNYPNRANAFWGAKVVVKTGAQVATNISGATFSTLHSEEGSYVAWGNTMAYLSYSSVISGTLYSPRVDGASAIRIGELETDLITLTETGIVNYDYPATYTEINRGTFLVNGTHNGSIRTINGRVGIISGTGAINGSILVNGSGYVAAGEQTSGGTLTVSSSGTVASSGGLTANFFEDGSHGMLKVNGTLTIGGAALLKLAIGGNDSSATAVPGRYKIATATSISGAFPNPALTALGAGVNTTLETGADPDTGGQAIWINIVDPSGETPPSLSWAADAGDQSAQAGETATFTVNAAGTGPFTYIWKKNDETISGATNASYTTPALTAADDGAVYTVYVKGAAYQRVSLDATLAIVAAPGFATDGDLPADTIAYDTDINLSVSVTGNPAPSLQWQISTDSGGTWSDISGETSATLALTGLSYLDTGNQYRVKLNNGVGGDIDGNVFSTVTTLTVNAGPRPALSVSPDTAQNVTRAAGSVSFSITNTGDAGSSLDWQAVLTDVPDWARISTATSGTNIGYVTVEYDLNPHGTLTERSTTLRVASAGATGSPVNIQITQAANPFVVIQVAFDVGEEGSVSPATKDITRELPYGALPVPAKPGCTFAGWFTGPDATGDEITQTTIVPDINNHTLYAAWVEIPVSAPSIANNYLPEQTVTLGRTFTITASATGSPAPTYRWQISTDGGSNWSDLSPANSNYSGVTTGTLNIARVNAGMNGYLFRYRAINDNGTTYSNPVKLVIAEAIFSGPSDLAFDSTGALYVADTPSNIIRRIDTSGSATIFAGASTTGELLDGTGTAARFNAPAAIVFNAAGELLVADKDNGAIRKITADAQVTTYASGLGKPVALAIDSAGVLYVADSTNHTISTVDTAGTVTIFAGVSGNSGGAVGAGTDALFNAPAGVVVDDDGYLFVADTGNHTLRTPDSLGAFLHYAGTPGISGSADGDAPVALLNNPRGLATDTAGNIYFADTGNHTIRVLAVDGEIITLAGTPGSSGLRDGSAVNALFNSPQSVALSPEGTLLVADTGNAVIREIIFTTGDFASAEVTTVDATTGATIGGGTNPGNSGSGGGGGGGGALSWWHILSLALLVAMRRVRK